MCAPQSTPLTIPANEITIKTTQTSKSENKKDSLTNKKVNKNNTGKNNNDKAPKSNKSNATKTKKNNSNKQSKNKKGPNGKTQKKKNNKPKPKKQPNVVAEQQELTLEEQGRYLALDCEMVGVGEYGLTSALARVSVVDYNNAVVFDTYVKVDEPVTDYRTFISGIREEHLQSDLAMGFEQCQGIIKKLLQNKILVGHALKNDMAVLQSQHPWYLCRDTAKYEPFMKKDKITSLLRPRKLKDLAETKLDRTIQIVGQEHCPIEDAIAALDLYKKARGKWEKVVEYKMNRTNDIEQEKSME